ncbi:hypothetical protein LSH36_186g00000 [Paralvinella palmiformis]|uniref:Uncharacterized protein n=1 Tax=Paralvinella palmiformis TaxID=53620 RepID=A0AAD9JRP1_9ANNE|nr:hypothetical protein LSH36_186g00000 [Paralvinella palmiformis]
MSIFKLFKYGDRRKQSRKKDLFGECNVTISDYVLKRGLNRARSEPKLYRSYDSIYYDDANRRHASRFAFFRSKDVCLQRAKENVETLYLAVGVSENIPGFLFVMETLLPQLFRGALGKCVKMSGLYHMFSSDVYRNETLTPEALAFPNKGLATDFELYYFVRQRFYLSMKKALEYRSLNNLEDTYWLHHRINN